jgi:hypothetical protein
MNIILFLDHSQRRAHFRDLTLQDPFPTVHAKTPASIAGAYRACVTFI